jgi:HemX protein
MLAALTDRQSLWFAAGFYLAGFLLGTFSLLRGGRPSGPAMYVSIAVGFALQTVGLYLRGHLEGECPLHNRFELFQFAAWSAISLYLVIGVTFRTSLLGYLMAGLSALFTAGSLLPASWDEPASGRIFSNHWIELHASLGLYSYGPFALLALTSGLFLLRNYSLKSKHVGGRFSFLPSILELDHMGVRLLVAGVALLGASVAVGVIYWVRDPASVTAAKFLTTLGVWAAYAVALGLRLRGRLLAKRFAATCLVLFAAALLSLWPVDASRHPAAAVKIGQGGRIRRSLAEPPHSREFGALS